MPETGAQRVILAETGNQRAICITSTIIETPLCCVGRGRELRGGNIKDRYPRPFSKAGSVEFAGQQSYKVSHREFMVGLTVVNLDIHNFKGIWVNIVYFECGIPT